MTLFWRFFISFWLTALLLASSFFLLGRYSGSEVIENAQQNLVNQASEISSFWQQRDGKRKTKRWLMQLPREQRPRVINANGFNILSRSHLKGMKPWRNGNISSGVTFEKRGIVSIVVNVPNVTPPLYLVKQIRPTELHNKSMPLMLLLAVLVIGIVSYVLARILIKRLRTLRDTVNIISHGDLNARVTLKGKDEVSALATDFNRMADHLNQMLDSQRQLVSDVSHELRSPLARLRVAIELSQQSNNSANAIQKISKEADELEQLVNSLLSLARMESGQSVLEKQSVALCPLITKIIEDANFEGEPLQRSVVLRHCDNVETFVDPVLISSAIENVVRNALHYTPNNGFVYVDLHKRNNEIVIVVDDQGPGVPEHELSRLFEPFTRIGEARDRLSGGYGLGLAITGRALAAHNGKASAENLKDNGLRITLTLAIQSNK